MDNSRQLPSAHYYSPAFTSLLLEPLGCELRRSCLEIVRSRGSQQRKRWQTTTLEKAKLPSVHSLSSSCSSSLRTKEMNICSTSKTSTDPHS